MSVKLIFFGDFVAVNPERLLIDDEIRSAILDADIAVCNFEAPIEGDYLAIDREGPRVNQPVDSVSFIENLGFNVVQLANNHMVDYGEEGCRATLKSFKKAMTLGVGTFEEAYKVKVLDINGLKIGFLACVHHEFGVLENNNKPEMLGTAWICHDIICQRIIEAKTSVDFLFVLPHAGIEEIDIPLPEWRDKYHHFIDCGADCIIGTHPHVPQGWEEYNSKMIFYSLGNFYFDYLKGDHPFWDKSLMLQLEVSEKRKMTYHVGNVCFEDYRIFKDNSQSTISHNEEICSVLQNEVKYKEQYDLIAVQKWYGYQNLLVRGLGAVSGKLHFTDFIKSIYFSVFKGRQKSLFQNCLQCESHRWMILRAQNLVK